jgi:molybdate transport system ATP-binding protein
MDGGSMQNLPANDEKAPSGAPQLETTVFARILSHDPELALTSLLFDDGELRLPMVNLPLGSSVVVKIDARDVSIALSRPMDVSITNRLPGAIDEIEYLTAPYVRATFSLGKTRLHSLITRESVVRLALVPGLKAWAMIKAVAITGRGVRPDRAPQPRSWPLGRSSNQETP